MSAESVHVIEDAFHRLQQPQEHALTDEDMADAARAAIWTCDPALRDCVHIAVSGGRVTLTGTVGSAEQRERVERAVLNLDHAIRSVVNRIEVAGTNGQSGTVPITAREMSPEPMLYVTRHCSVDPSSMTAALEDAIASLDARFAALNLAAPEEVVVVYRNRLPETAVLDVGFVLPRGAAVPAWNDDELKAGTTPAGATISALAERGARGLFDLHDHLVRDARLADLSPRSFAYQRFPLQEARLRADRPVRPLYLAVE
jgi:hypothetical protein